ncbi:hypothetical protein KI387_033335, partial [Taxus chinensis]
MALMWERNKRIFKGEKHSPEQVVLRLEWAISESVSSCWNRNSPFSNKDREIQNRWPSILKPKDGALKSSTPLALLRKSVCWSPPSSSFFKLNFDGAARGNLGALGAGCIIRDELNQLIWAASYKLKVRTFNVVELQDLNK